MTDVIKPFSKRSLKCPNCGANVTEDCVRCDYCRAVLTITACPSCFGPVFKGMKYCPVCGTAIERNEVSRDQKLLCPRCEQLLNPVDISGTRIYECTVCGGLWLDTDSFGKICDDREKQEKVLLYPSTSTTSNVHNKAFERKRFYVPCPICGNLMNQRNFAGCSGIILDICKPHGIWFERQELQKIINFIKDGGLQIAREKELDNLKAERQRLEALQYSQNLDIINTNVSRPTTMWGVEKSMLEIVISIFRKIFS